MKITVEIELTAFQMGLIRGNSLERVLNNAIYVGGAGEHELKNESDREAASILWQDCSDMKPTLMTIWHAVSNAVFIALQDRSLNPMRGGRE